MTKKLLSMLAAGALVAFASTAYAGQPQKLADNQMDSVTAGAVGIANAVSVAFGEVLSDTYSQTSTNVSTAAGVPKFAIGQAFSQALAAGGFLFNAAAASHADSTASF